jgi:hypothetical protein
VILQIGQQLRDSITGSVGNNSPTPSSASEAPAVVGSPSVPRASEAA